METINVKDMNTALLYAIVDWVDRVYARAAGDKVLQGCCKRIADMLAVRNYEIPVDEARCIRQAFRGYAENHEDCFEDAVQLDMAFAEALGDEA